MNSFFSAFLAIMVIAFGGIGMTASAEEAKGEITEKVISETISSNEDDTAEMDDNSESTETTEEISFSEDTTEISSDIDLSNDEYDLIRELTDGIVKEDEKIDYYGDDYYDTSGNASLIKSERIIYDTEAMQFIAVTTKDGAVFYILINYSADDDEQAVYFLNKVDTFDLYSLLYMTDEEEENGIDVERAKRAEAEALNPENWEKLESSIDDTSTESETEEAPVQQTGSSNMMLYLLFGAIALGGAGFAGFKILSKPKSKPAIEKVAGIEDDEDFDFYDSDEEVNEDNE